jgi:hypothetical protein
VNCIRVPWAPSHIAIGNFPPPRPLNEAPEQTLTAGEAASSFAHSRKEAEMSIFDEQYRVIAVESDRLLVRGILSGEVLTIINPEPETPLTQEDYPAGKLIALTDPLTAPLN